jgi:hypothetical protein
MIQTIKTWFTGQARSSQWAKVRAQYLERWNYCAACGRKDKLEVHHITPVFADPSRELEIDNLITLCRPVCHFLYGHLNNWKSYNIKVRQDAAYILSRITSRPEF